jgi:hypothetical protein
MLSSQNQDCILSSAIIAALSFTIIYLSLPWQHMPGLLRPRQRLYPLPHSRCRVAHVAG